MKITLSWGKLLSVLVELYKAVFSGKTITVDGEQITLPNQGHTPPLKGSPFDSKPHKFDAPPVGRAR